MQIALSIILNINFRPVPRCYERINTRFTYGLRIAKNCKKLSEVMMEKLMGKKS